jgi:hypothetical protein
VVFFVMLGVSVSIAIFAYLPLLKLVGEVSGGSNRFGISFHTHSLMDVCLCDIRIDCAGGKCRIGHV